MLTFPFRISVNLLELLCFSLSYFYYALKLSVKSPPPLLLFFIIICGRHGSEDWDWDSSWMQDVGQRIFNYNQRQREINANSVLATLLYFSSGEIKNNLCSSHWLWLSEINISECFPLTPRLDSGTNRKVKLSRQLENDTVWLSTPLGFSPPFSGEKLGKPKM